MDRSFSERFIDALLQLEQFLPFNPPENDRHALHTLTGVRAFAVSDPEEQAHELILLKYPGGQEAQVSGRLYLGLQIEESVHHELASSGVDSKRLAARIEELREHLYRKHAL